MGFSKNGLVFREVEEFDLPRLRDWRNSPEMSAGWHDPGSVQTLEQQQRWYTSLDRSNQAFILEDQAVVVGLLRFRLYPGSHSAITGIDVNPLCHSKGYGKRILSGGAEYVLRDLGYHRTTGEALDTNIAAQRIITACGFKLEGRYRDYVWREGKWHDWLIYSLLQREVLGIVKSYADQYVEGMKEL